MEKDLTETWTSEGALPLAVGVSFAKATIGDTSTAVGAATAVAVLAVMEGKHAEHFQVRLLAGLEILRHSRTLIEAHLIPYQALQLSHAIK